MAASHYYLTCTATNGDTGESRCVSVLAIIDDDRLVFYVTPSPQTTHIVTATVRDAPVALALLDRMGLPVPTLASDRSP